MNYQRSRKTLVPSNRKFHQGMIVIVGRLVVLSVFMLVLGATSTKARNSQDERCEAFTKQAHGICRKAVKKGCFDGVESRACEVLTTRWNEKCRVCEGPPPWEEEEVLCPCAVQVGSAQALNATFETMAISGQVECFSIDIADTLRIVRRDFPDRSPAMEVVVRSLVGLDLRCEYSVFDASGEVVVEADEIFDTADELEACREDIGSLLALLREQGKC
jgi:hypothetical protein